MDLEQAEALEVDAALMHEASHDLPTVLTPAQALTTVEDRQDMVRKLTALQDNKKQEHRGQDKPCQSLLEMEVCKKGGSEGSFTKILKAAIKLKCFNEGDEKFHGASGLLDRMAFLFDHLKSFTQRVRTAEGLLQHGCSSVMFSRLLYIVLLYNSVYYYVLL